jgi:protein-tyrosine phosphatase
MYKIIFVCTGNICRSPTADGILQHHIRTKQLEDKLFSDSAGLERYHVGESPDNRSIATAKRNNIDIAHLRARQFTIEDFERFDLILAMDDGHYQRLINMAPQQHKNKVVLFLDYIDHPETSNVPDPYYDDLEAFEYVFDLLLEAIEKLMTRHPE